MKQNIQKWLRNFCECILTQWQGQLLDSEHLLPELSQNILGNAWRASKPVSKSVQTCGHQHSHIDKVVPAITNKKVKIREIIFLLLQKFLHEKALSHIRNKLYFPPIFFCLWHWRCTLNSISFYYLSVILFPCKSYFLIFIYVLNFNALKNNMTTTWFIMHFTYYKGQIIIPTLHTNSDVSRVTKKKGFFI